MDEGRVVEEPGAKPFRWQAAEMISPITRGLRGALDSKDYAKAVAQARDSTKFHLTA